MLVSSPRPAFGGTIALPLFLAPAFAELTISTSRAGASRTFSCSAINSDNRKRSRETNKNRGVSVIRRSGPRVPLSISKFPLPRPVDSPEKRAEFKTKDDHGLWQFFNEARQPTVPAEEESAIGRSWTYQELSGKSFDDLHSLYWVCIKEWNRSETRRKELQRIRTGFGLTDSRTRITKIKQTMGNIRSVLRDRYETRAEARHLLERPGMTLERVLEAEYEQPFETSAFQQSSSEQEPAHFVQR